MAEHRTNRMSPGPLSLNTRELLFNFVLLKGKFYYTSMIVKDFAAVEGMLSVSGTCTKGANSHISTNTLHIYICKVQFH